MKGLFGHWELYGVIFAGRLSIVTMHYHKLFTTVKTVPYYNVITNSKLLFVM